MVLFNFVVKVVLVRIYIFCMVLGVIGVGSLRIFVFFLRLFL